MDKKLRMQLIMSAMDKVTSPLKKIRDGSTSTSKALKTTNDRLKDLQAKQKMVGQFRELRSGTRATSADLLQAQNRVNQLAHEISQTSNPTRKMTREFDAAKRTADALGKKAESQGNKLQALRTKLSAAGISTRNLSRHERTLRRDINETTAALERQKNKMSLVARARSRLQGARARAGQLAGTGARMLAVGGGALYAGARMAMPGLDFGEEMSNVRALTRLQANSPEYKALKQQARHLGATTSFTATEAAGAQGFLGMAGFNPKAIKSAMPGVLNLSRAGRTDLARTADISSNILTGFDLKANQMGRVGDVLVGTFTRSNTNLEMLGETMKYVAPVASNLGVQLETTAAMAGKLGDAGIQGGMAGTASRAILSRLAAPTSEARKAMKELNLQTTDAKGNLRPVVDILTELQNKTKGMGDSRRTSLLKSIAGEEAFSALNILMKSAGSGELQKLVSTLKAAKGEAHTTAKIMNDNTRGDLKALSSAWQDFGITVLSTNKGPLRGTIQLITGMVRGISGWAQRNPVLSAGLVKIAAVLATLIATGGAFTLMLASVLAPIALVKFGMASLGLQGGILTSILGGVGRAIMFIGRAAMMNPIGLLVTGLAVAGYLVYRHWDTIKTAFGDAIEWFKGLRDQFFSFGKNIIQGLLAGIKAGTGAVLGKMKSVAADIAETFQASMGIHSPSRLFAQYGDFTMQGLAQGLDRRADLPLQKVSAMAGRMKQIGAGIAIGAASLPAGAFDTRPPIAGQKAPTAISSSNTYQIHVHAAPGMDENALARAVARELDKRDREKAAQRRSSLIDYDD